MGPDAAALRGELRELVKTHIAEDYLGAFTDNPASMAVSRKVGYRPNGHTRHERREGELAICDRVVLAPKDLLRPEHDLVVEGVGPVRRLIGLDA